MSGRTSLLTFGIGPVHTFIAQARRIADVWAGSHLLSHLIRQAMGVVHRDPDARSHLIFPFIDKADPSIPDGVPNRFVCRVPAGREEEIAARMKSEVEHVWNGIVRQALDALSEYGIEPSPELTHQTGRLLQIAWSWVPEPPGPEGYARAALEGARRYAAARLFRPFPQADELGEKCAICGERTALPDGNRRRVETAWRAAEEMAGERKDGAERFLRYSQSRLCLVCATKRFFTYVEAEERRRSRFLALDEFQPNEDEPYIAMVKLDGDRMGALLALGPDAVLEGDLERFHRAVSKALTDFASELRTPDSPELNLRVLKGYQPVGRKPPQLLYAGGDDALFVCDPRDALPVAVHLRSLYADSFATARQCLLREADRERLTMSGAIYFAHSGHPAGLLLHDLENLLKEVAKGRGGRDALALRLEKRGGAPVDVVLPWQPKEGVHWIDEMEKLVALLRQGGLSSSQTFSLRLEERTLQEVFARDEENARERWQAWLAERLTRNAGTAARADDLARSLVPFFVHEQTGALRVARFLGHEVERGGNRP